MRTEHVDSDGEVHETALTDKDLREAYDRGRRDEAVRHRRNWLLTIVIALLALAGVIVLALAALNGSFQRGGAVIDRQLSIAADQAEPAIRNAAGEAAEEIREARTGQPAPDATVVQTPAGPQGTTTATSTTTTTPEAQ